MSVKSLPLKFKEYLSHNVRNDVVFTSYICRFAHGRVENGYQLSAVDIDSNDWILLDENAEPIKLNYKENDVLTNTQGERIVIERIIDGIKFTIHEVKQVELVQKLTYIY